MAYPWQMFTNGGRVGGIAQVGGLTPNPDIAYQGQNALQQTLAQQGYLSPTFMSSVDAAGGPPVPHYTGAGPRTQTPQELMNTANNQTALQLGNLQYGTQRYGIDTNAQMNRDIASGGWNNNLALANTNNSAEAARQKAQLGMQDAWQRANLDWQRQAQAGQQNWQAEQAGLNRQQESALQGSQQQFTGQQNALMRAFQQASQNSQQGFQSGLQQKQLTADELLARLSQETALKGFSSQEGIAAGNRQTQEGINAANIAAQERLQQANQQFSGNRFNQLYGTLMQQLNGGGGGGPAAPDLSVGPTISANPVFTPELLQSMQNNARARAMQGAQTEQRNLQSSAANRGLGPDSAGIMAAMGNMGMSGRQAGESNALNLGTQAATANADQVLRGQTAQAGQWNQYQGNLLNRYQAQNQSRNAILAMISSLMGNA